MKHSLGPRLQRREWLLAALAVLTGQSGCGGVESGGTGTGSAPQTLAVGSITGFGSIIVGGVRYDDASATIEDDDGRAITSAQLKLGMQATVMASAITTTAGVSSATASSVAVRSDIIGPIESIDAAGGELTVLGQRVAVVASTVFDDTLAMGLVALTVGDVIEVHGAYDAATGRCVATRIDRHDAPATYKLRGPVSTLSLTSQTLTIGMAMIDWSAVAPADPAMALAPGSVVRVVLATTPASGGVWRATTLDVVTVMLADRARVEVEGRITAFTSIAAFAINGLPVNATSASFPDGTAGVVLGAKVEVKGSAVGGVIVAQEVEIESDDDGSGFELHGSVESVDAPAQRFVVRGVTVVWNASTRFESSTAADIQAGRQVEVKGALSSDGTRLDADSIHVER